MTTMTCTKEDLVYILSVILLHIPPKKLENLINHLFGLEAMTVKLQDDGSFLVTKHE